MSSLLILPIALPMLTGALMLFISNRHCQRWVAFGGACALLASTIGVAVAVHEDGIQVLHAGGWAAPFGIVLVADRLSSILLVAVGVVGVAATGFAFAGVDPRRESAGYHPVMMVLMMGVSGAFLTGDL